MPKIKILGLPKFVVGGPNDCPEGYVYDESLQNCVPDNGYQEQQKFQVNPTLSSGKAKTGPGTGVNPAATKTSVDVKCREGFVKNSKGECVPKKTNLERWSDTIGAGMVLGNALAQAKENKDIEDAFKRKMRNQLFTGLGMTPPKTFKLGQEETVSGVDWPNMMTPPNAGMFSNAFYGSLQAQLGGQFMGQEDEPRTKIRILETPDGLPQQMKYGGQSSYGLDLGWKIGYTDMAKTSSDHITGSMSEDGESEEPPVLEAEDNETLYKPGDQTLHRISGKRHSEGGVALTGSQVNSEESDIPSFIFSDTKALKIKDPKVLQHFGITKFKKGGVTPAEISKKFDLNKFKAILEDPNKDKLAKDTAQMMLNKNEKYLAELAAFQEQMKGEQVPEFVKGKMSQAKFGGRLDRFIPKYAEGGPDDDWIKQILNFESTKGSATGKGLPNFGINRKKWESKYPAIWKDSKVDEKEAIDFFKQEILPKVKDYPIEVRKRLADYVYNTGRSIEDLLLFADGKITLDDINSSTTFTSQWNNAKDDIIKKMSDPSFVKKLDDAKLEVYKTTKSVNGKPNPAFDLSWKDRVNMFSGDNTSAGNNTGSNTTSTGSGTGTKSGGKLGQYSQDYATLEKLLKDDSNKALRSEIYNRYKKKYPKSPVTEDQYINNLLEAQKQFYAINEAYKDDKAFLTDREWDRTKNNKKNKRYRETSKKLGFTPLSETDIIRFQSAYRDLEDAMRDPEFFETFGKYFSTDPKGVADQVYPKGSTRPVSPADGIAGNTTIGELFRLRKDETPPPPPPGITTTTTMPPKERGPRYICSMDEDGNFSVKETSGSGVGYASAEEAAKNCGKRPERAPFDYLAPDKMNMLAQAAIFPEMILPFAPDLQYTPGQLNLEDWRAKAAQRFSTQYAAPAAQLAQFTGPQGLTANLSFLAGQTAQQMAAEDIAPTISRNVDRANQFSQQELARQDAVNQFNVGQKMKRYEGWATARQQYKNALRKYLKDNSDAFTRAWNNRMNLGDINDSNTNFYKSARTGRNIFYNPNTRGIAGLQGGSSGTGDLGSSYNTLYKQYFDALTNVPEADKPEIASKLAYASLTGNKVTTRSKDKVTGTTTSKTGFDLSTSDEEEDDDNKG